MSKLLRVDKMSQANKLTGQKDRAPSEGNGKDDDMSKRAKFEPGMWYRWNGGDCPVPDHTIVQILEDLDTEVWEDSACEVNWREMRGCFTIPPRNEWWLYDGDTYFSLNDAKRARDRDLKDGHYIGRIAWVMELLDE